jgi:hypothetical protein
MGNPLIVYLDSQDFSRFSPSSGEYDKYLPIMDELLQLKAEGIAQFVFSDIHIFEAFPVDLTARELGIERIRTIQKFCDGNNLPSSSEIMELELQRVAVKDPRFKRRFSLNEHKDWFPKFNFPEPDKKNYARVLKQQAFQHAKNRHDRRRLVSEARSALLKRNLSDETVNLVMAEFMHKFPFLQKDEPVIANYFRGQANWTDMQSAVKRALRDIVSFSEWLASNWDQGEKFIESLREREANFSKSSITFYTQMKALNAELEPTISREKLDAIMKKTIIQRRPVTQKKMLLKLAKDLLKIDLDPTDERFQLTESDTPSLLAFHRFCFEVLATSGVAEKPRNPLKHNSKSDYADAMHVMFVPRVNVFRGDKFSSGILRRVYQRDDFCVVDSIWDLPNVIKTMALKQP